MSEMEPDGDRCTRWTDMSKMEADGPRWTIWSKMEPDGARWSKMGRMGNVENRIPRKEEEKKWPR